MPPSAHTLYIKQYYWIQAAVRSDPKYFRTYQTDCLQAVQQEYSVSKIPQRDAELPCYETGYFYKPSRLSARTVGLTSWLTDRLLTKLRPKLKLCSDVTTVIGRRTGESVWGGMEGRKKKEMPALSDCHRNSVVDLHRVSVPHYENVQRHSLDNVYHNVEVIKPISPLLRTHPCNHPLMEQSKFTYTP